MKDTSGSNDMSNSAQAVASQIKRSAGSERGLRLAVYSDLHTEHALFEPPAGLQADVVVLAGDIHSPGHKVARWARRSQIFGDRPIVHVAGNHEFYGTEYRSQKRLMQEHAERVGVHSLGARTVVIGGVRFVGCTLWTDFALRIGRFVGGEDGQVRSDIGLGMAEADMRLNDYACIQLQASEGVESGGAARTVRRRLRPQDTLVIHWRERNWLLSELNMPFDGPTVVVTHHAPHRNSLSDIFAPDQLSAAFVSELPEEFFRVPVLWIHGHTHTSFDYQIGGCRVVCNPRGYPNRWQGGFENSGFDPMGLGIVVGRFGLEG